MLADKARDFIGKGHPGGEQKGEGTQEDCSAMWLTVLDFMVMGFVSGLSLAHHSNSGSFLVVRGSRRMVSNEKDSGRLVGHTDWRLLSPFDLSQILPIGGGLLVPCSLPGPPGKITYADGYSGAGVGSFSQWFRLTLPLTVFQ